MTRIGIIGAGAMAGVHVPAWRAAGAEVVAVAGRRGGRHGAFADAHGLRACDDLDDLMAHVDVVDVCTPTDVHLDQIRRAAAAGRDVVCEKPLARTSAEAREAVAACAAAGVRLFVGHVARYVAPYAAAKAQVDAGVIGDPAVLRLRRVTYQPRKAAGNWFTDTARSGGLLLDLMIHDFDYARWVAGEVSTVWARSVRAADPGAATDHALVVLQHHGGAITHVEGSWAYPAPTFSKALQISGTRGVCEYESDTTAPVRALVRDEDRPVGDVPLAAPTSGASPWQVQFADFLAALGGGPAPRVSAEDAVAAVEIAEAAQRSAETGEAIVVGTGEVEL